MLLSAIGSVIPAGAVTVAELTTLPAVAAIALTGMAKAWFWPVDRAPAVQVTVCPATPQPAGKGVRISNSGAI
ncbi:hypothetical protein D3C80_1037620 [compost metagenome]